MTDEQLIEIAATAGFRPEYRMTNPAKLVGFGKLAHSVITGSTVFLYAIPVDDFRAIVEASREAERRLVGN